MLDKPTVKKTAESLVRDRITDEGGKICDRLHLHEFEGTGRGIGTKKPVYTFEKVIDIPQTLGKSLDLIQPIL